ncbi:MAG: spermine/spermidine synthase domain-containing protein [Gammaproteobacteria bacterium]
MSESSLEHSTTIYQEMLTHPILFSHLCPQRVAIIGDENNGILDEVLKHDTVTEVWHISKNDRNTSTDERVKFKEMNTLDWIHTVTHEYFDVFIVTEKSSAEMFTAYFNTLNHDGVLIQLSGSPFQVNDLKIIQKQLLSAGFRDVLTLSFPQPSYPTGSRCALLAKKTHIFKKIREKDIFNKTFITRFYNFDVHKGALVMPEFMREELMV